jgi:purine-nucleoside phosphorylase
MVETLRKQKDPTEFGAEFKSTTDFYNAVLQAAEYIRTKLGIDRLDAALVFGSGHRALADEISDPVVLHYGDIPNFPLATNIGHGSELVYGLIHGRKVILFKGRFHLVEGYRSFYHAWLGYLAALLGCELLISTNSCGAITTKLEIGDIMIMGDHLNCSYMPFVNAPILDGRLRSSKY